MQGGSDCCSDLETFLWMMSARFGSEVLRKSIRDSGILQI